MTDHTARTQRELMAHGELYFASDPELVGLRANARRLTRLYNTSREDEGTRRTELLRELLGACGEGVEIEPDFRCDYGFNISLGDRVYMNFGCVILDCARVEIGEDTLIGPGVHLYGATHPTDHETRRSKREYARPIRIGRNCWLGGGVIVCPGVTIGDNAIIGAGSVVTADVAKGEIAVGNPARIRTTGAR
jgi:maltose O-acetyltransferase